MENISFTRIIKEELVTLEALSSEEHSILAAFIRQCGSLIFSSGKMKLVLKTENSSIAKYIYKLIKKYYSEKIVSFSFLKSMKLYKNIEYLINIDDGGDVLDDLKIDFLDTKIAYSLQNKEDKIRGYLIGAFLASGSCTDPHSSNYHFEFAVNEEGYGQSLLKLISKIKNTPLGFKCVQRRNKYIVYLKRSDQISGFLAFLGANNGCLKFEDIRINRDYSNATNRLINCDSNNFKKTVEIAKKQEEWINEIDRRLGIDNIQNEKMKLLCKARLSNLEANYTELAEIIGEELGETVSKSNVNHLFIKIRKLAEEYKDRYDN